MRKILLTTALALPLGAGFGFAQTTTTTTTEPDAANGAATTIEQGVAATGEAAGDAAEAVGDAAGTAGSALEQAGDDAEAAGDAAQAEADADAAADGTVTTTTTTDTDATTTTTDGMTTTTDGMTTDATTDTMATDTAATAAQIVRDQAPNELRIDWITGASVESPAGEKIGDIRDLIINEQGQITAAIIGVGGFLGIGEKQIAVDWAQLQIDYDGQRIATTLSKEEAQAAPAYVFREKQDAPAEMGTTATETESAPVTSTAEPDTTMTTTDGTSPDLSATTGDEAAGAAATDMTDAAEDRVESTDPDTMAPADGTTTTTPAD